MSALGTLAEVSDLVPNPNWRTVFPGAMIGSLVVWLRVSEETVSPRK